MKKLETAVRGLLVCDGFREAGEMDVDGKKVSWPAGFIVTIVGLYDTTGRARKYTVDPQYVSVVEAKLAGASWGSVVELDLDGKLATGVTVLYDWLDGFSVE